MRKCQEALSCWMQIALRVVVGNVQCRSAAGRWIQWLYAFERTTMYSVESARRFSGPVDSWSSSLARLLSASWLQWLFRFSWFIGSIGSLVPCGFVCSKCTHRFIWFHWFLVPWVHLVVSVPLYTVEKKNVLRIFVCIYDSVFKSFSAIAMQSDNSLLLFAWFSQQLWLSLLFHRFHNQSLARYICPAGSHFCETMKVPESIQEDTRGHRRELTIVSLTKICCLGCVLHVMWCNAFSSWITSKLSFLANRCGVFCEYGLCTLDSFLSYQTHAIKQISVFIRPVC